MNDRFRYNSALLQEVEAMTIPQLTEQSFQRIVETLADMITKAIGINQAACEGLIWKAIQQWQQETNLDKISQNNSEKRNKQLNEIFVHFENQITPLLLDQEHLIEFKAVLSKTFENYLQSRTSPVQAQTRQKTSSKSPFTKPDIRPKPAFGPRRTAETNFTATKTEDEKKQVSEIGRGNSADREDEHH